MKKTMLICCIITQYLTASSIIFDLGNVLMYPDRTIFARQIGISMIAEYSLCYNPLNLEKDFFTFLHTLIPATDQHPGYLNEKKLPQIINEWHKGTYTSQWIKDTAKDHVHNYCIGDIQAAMFLAVADTMFTPSLLAECLTICPQAIACVQLCRTLGHNTYLLSNLDAETFECLKKKYPWFTELFDGIIISGDEGYIKPDPQIYQLAIERFNIDPFDTVFIDDSPLNLEPAQKIGIFTILCKQYKDGIHSKPYFKYVNEIIKLWWHAQFCKKYYELTKNLNIERNI